MGALIVLLVLIPVIMLVLLIGIFSRTSEHQQAMKEVNEKLDQVTRQFREMQSMLQTKEKEEKKPVAAKTPPPIPEIKPYAPVTPPPVVIPIKEQPLPETPAGSVYKKPVIPPPVEIPEEIDERKFTEEETWLQRNPDLERFIGENLANKIGIAVLVLGIAFFVKYAIDKNWINETGRVVIGLVSGGILIGIAHYIRNSYRSFSSVLVGGGLTVFYFSIAFAFHQYQLIGQQAAFIIMVVITAFAVTLSLYYKRQELAILAAIGGFITPFLVTTGKENYIALFTYLCILNTGLMVLSWFKRWPAINSIALFFTTVIYGSWMIKRTVWEDFEKFPYKDALLFATLFYILFIVMNIVNSLRTKRSFTAFDFIIVLSVNFLYYLAGIVCLGYGNDAAKGLFTASLGIANCILAAFFYKKQTIDRNFISLLIGLALSFLSLAVPVQFKGNQVVLFWAAESVILLWLYQRSRIVHLKLASAIVAVLMLGSLLLTWASVYLFESTLLPVIANKGFITTLVVSVALFIYYRLLHRTPEDNYIGEINNRQVKNIFLVVSIIVAYLAGVLEIFYQFNTRFPQVAIHTVYTQAYSFAVAILLLQVFKRSAQLPLLKFLLTTLCLGLYLFNLKINYTVSLELLTQANNSLFIAHWIAALLLGWLLYDLIRFFFRQNQESWLAYRPAFTWVAATSIVLLLSVEMYHIMLWTNYRNEEDWPWWENLYYKAGLTILWSICSFTMIWLGMKFSFRTLRIISLSLFTITLIKLFSYDIRNIPPGGKIAAFILLGILLLTVSFMYQRLKKIIIDDAIDH